MEKIYLKNGLWTAEITPSLGANVTKLFCAEQQVLRMPEQSADAYQFGMPILIPANRTEAGKFSFEGKDYQLPVNEPHVPAQLHGLVHDQHFTVEEFDQTHAVLSYENTPDIYPFPFRLTVSYELKENGLYVSHQLKNIGAGNMPYTFCLHTTFVAPTHFKVPLGLEQEKNERNLPTGNYIPLSEELLPLTQGMNPYGVPTSGFYRAAGHQAEIDEFRYTISENYDHWVLYSASGKDGFLCVEPQCGGVNGLNQHDNHRVLHPGEFHTFNSSITK